MSVGCGSIRHLPTRAAMIGGKTVGARTNFVIRHSDNPAENINIYSHWGGDGLETMRGAVAAARPRWNDTSYAVRIIVDQITKEGRDQETGFGIYVGEDITHEEEYSYKEIDLVNKTITYGELEMSFEKFIEE